MNATPHVVLVGATDDPQLQSVRSALHDRGAETDVWNSDRWPGELPISMHVGGESERYRVGELVDEVDAVYLRNAGLDPRYDKFEGTFEQRPISLFNQLREYRGLLFSLLARLEDRGVDVVNSVQSPSVHQRKPWQLAVLAEADLPVPRTLATNAPDDVRAFVEEVDAAIYKPVAGGGFARAVTPEDLASNRLARLASSPVQFQERVEGDNLRLFVVGDRVAASGRIVTDELDYRTSDHDVESVDPPQEVRDAAVDAAAHLDLQFAGVDIIDAGDRFVILEANPSPMFAHFDELAGTDVGGALADALTR